MFLHQFSDDLVLALELVAQCGDRALEMALGRGVLPFEGRRAVLEELLLPEVEQCGRELVLVAEVRDGDVVDEMTPQDGDLLDRRIVLSGLPHGETPAELSYNSGGASLHFRLKQDSRPVSHRTLLGRSKCLFVPWLSGRSRWQR